MHTGTQLGAAIEEARKLKRITKKDLAQRFGVAPPSVQDWVNRGTIRKEVLLELIRYFSDVVTPEHWGMAEYPWGTHVRGVPLRIDPAPSNLFPPLTEWENLMSLKPGTRIILTVRDAALAPRLAVGDWVMIDAVAPDAEQPPRIGDGVLLRTAAGEHYLRIYRQRAPGDWHGAALNPDYADIDPDRDEAVVVGIVTGSGKSGRWS